MLIRITSALLLTVLLFSCKKDDIEEPRYLPPVLEMDRTVTLPLQSNLQKKASYTHESGLTSYAWVEDGQLSVTFVAEPGNGRTTGDGITFRINASHLMSLQKTYTYDAATDKIDHIRYTFTDQSQSTRIRIIDTEMGSSFTGTFRILGYNEEEKLIAGDFEVEVPDLIYDPTNLQVAVPGAPQDQSHLKLTGHFANVKIK